MSDLLVGPARGKRHEPLLHRYSTGAAPARPGTARRPEGRLRDVRSVRPSAPAQEWSAHTEAMDLLRGVVARRRGLATAVAALVAAVAVGVVHARGMYIAPIRFDDEGTYVSQAHSLLTQGTLAPYTYWYDHPPLGWMIIAGWMGTVGAFWHAPNLIGSGRQLMLVLDVVTVVLVVLLARRMRLPAWAACAAALLYGLSPLALTYHRMVLLDNIATPLLLGAFLLAMSPGRRLGSALASGVLVSSAVLVKETVLLMLPFVLWEVWRSFRGTTRRMCLAVFALGVALPGLLYPLFAVTKGELVPGLGHVSLYQGVFFQLLGRKSSGSVLDPTSDAHAVVAGWLSIDTRLVVAGCVAVLPALAVRALRPIAAALLFSGLAILRPGYLPVPYVVALIPFAALAVAGVPGAFWSRVVRWLVRPASPDRASSLMPGLAHLDDAARRATALVVLVGVAVGAGAGVQSVRSTWYYADRSLMDGNFDLPYTDSTAWLEANVPKGQTLLVDNVTWTSLLSDGYPQQSLVWFTKPDADSAVDRRIRSYHDLQWVVSTDIMRTSRQNGGTVKDALTHSTLVATWGSGSHEVQIRKVTP